MDSRPCDECGIVIPYYMKRCAICTATIVATIEPTALDETTTASFDGELIYVETPTGSISFSYDMLNKLTAYKQTIMEKLK